MSSLRIASRRAVPGLGAIPGPLQFMPVVSRYRRLRDGWSASFRLDSAPLNSFPCLLDVNSILTVSSSCRQTVPSLSSQGFENSQGNDAKERRWGLPQTVPGLPTPVAALHGIAS